MKKILITGASGLVGSALLSELRQVNGEYEIFAASSKFSCSYGDRIYYIPNVEINNVMKENKIDLLVQVAFPRNVNDEQWADGFKFVSDILWMAKRHNVQRVINISSQSLYGWKRTKAAKEEDSIFLNSPYNTGKYFIELLIQELFPKDSYTNIRLSTIIGPHTNERVPNKLFSKIFGGEDLIIKGGQQIFSFLDIRDAASGLARMITSRKKWRPIYNLGTSEYATLLEIAQEVVNIGKKYGFFSNITIKPSNDFLNNRIDVSAMKKDFDWTAKYNLKDSLEYIFVNNYFGMY